MAEHFFLKKKEKVDHPVDIVDLQKTSNLLRFSEVGTVGLIDFMMIDQLLIKTPMRGGIMWP